MPIPENSILACLKYGSKEFRKNGRVQARQRYLCQSCGYNFSVPKLGKAKPIEIQRQALHRYLEGMSFRGIERLLGISHVTVMMGVRRWGKAIQCLRKQQKPVKVEEVEIDELCTFMGQKNRLWGWIGEGGRCWILWWVGEGSAQGGGFMAD